jgi:type 1 fimbria pilin
MMAAHPKSYWSTPMKKLLSLFAAIAILFSSAAAFAADVTGAWTGDVGGQFQITFNFKQDGTKLTGSVQGPDAPINITDGKVDGDKISFTVEFNGNTIHHTGTVTGDTIKLTTEGGEMAGGEMTLKRADAAPAAAPSN